MATITLTNVPEELAARWEQIPEEDRDVYVLADLFDEFEPIEVLPASDEDLQALGESFADADAGRVVDRDTFFQEVAGWRQSLRRDPK